MRILWITPGFASDENDLNCIPTMQLLARELMLQGVDLQIVTLEYPFRSQPYCWRISPPSESLSRDFGRLGEANVFPCNGQNRRWLKGRTLWRATTFCRKILDAVPLPSSFPKKEVIVIHSFWLGWASGLGERLSRRHRVPHLTTLMGQDVLPQNRKFMYGLSAGRAARFVAVSDFQNDIFEKNAGMRAAQVIPWGVDESEIPAGLSAEKPLDVLGAGSLVPVKNWEKWLRVIALAVRTAPGLRAELIGDGVERAKLERLARQLGLEKNVRFAGSLPRPEVLAKMRDAKILLHTAHYESFGYVLAEAAMNGCRVVGTPVGAMAQFGKTAGNESELAALVLDALGQPVQNQPFVPFTMRQTAEAYLKIYRDL